MNDPMSINHMHTDEILISGSAVERILRTLDLAALACDVPAVAQAAFGCDTVALFLSDPDPQIPLANAPVGAAASPELIRRLAQAAHQQRAAFLIERSDAAHEAAVRRLLREEGFHTAIAAALRLDGGGSDALILLWRRPDLDAPVLGPPIAELARIVAIAVANARAFRAAERARSSALALLDATTEALLVIDSGTHVVQTMNRAAEEMSGYHGGRFTGLALNRILRVTDEIHGPLGATGHLRAEGLLVRKDQSLLPVVVIASAHPDDPARLVLSVCEMSDRWRPLKSLMLSEKIAGMSRLTNMIAHEINNPLQAIAGSLQVLGRPLEAEKRERYLSLAQAELDRLIGLVRRTLEIHQPTREGRRPVAINPLIESVIGQIASSAELQHVTIELDLVEGPTHVIGISSHLRELFLSLARNAIEAMPDGGRLTVRTQIEAGGGAMLTPQIAIEFIDTGPGIAEEHLEQIFEPFFTTKHGQYGMGLTICYSIVEHHAGRLAVSSSERGVTFRVSLPLEQAG